jgi:hypothetical protein
MLNMIMIIFIRICNIFIIYIFFFIKLFDKLNQNIYLMKQASNFTFLMKSGNGNSDKNKESNSNQLF